MNPTPDTPNTTPAEDIKLSPWEKFVQFIKQPWAASVLTLIGTLGAAYFTFQVQNKNATISFEDVGAKNFQQLFDLQSKQITDLKTENKELELRIEDLTKQVQSLQIAQLRNSQNALLFNNSIDNFPFPYWVKSREGRMVKINTAFEDAYLKPVGKDRLDYIDKTDYDIWTDEEANNFAVTDNQVVRTKKEVVFIETITLNGKKKRLLVTKFPIFLSSEVIGIAGFSVPKEFISDNYQVLMNTP